MFKIIKTKKILSSIIIFSVIGIIFVSSFSSIVKAQVRDDTGADLYQPPAPTNQNTTPSTPNSDTTTLPEYQAILDQHKVKDETRTETNLQGTGVVNYKDTVSQSGLPWWAKKIINWAIKTVRQFLTNLIINVFSPLITYALELNNQLFNADNTFIQDGWKASRDVANLGFILAIIVIAFATILRYEAYGVKKILAKVIVVALLINFSLMICAALSDLSNVVTKTFLATKVTSTTGNQATIGDDLGKNLAGTVMGDSTKMQTDAAALLTDATLGNLFFIICLLIMVITLIAIFIMLLIRYVWLGLLVILSPLAWFCAILPATQKLFKQWWDLFIKWILFAPAMAFFIWLAMLSGTSFAGTGAVSTIGNMFIKVGLLLGGLIIANNLSIAGAKQFQKLAVAGAVGVGAGTGMWAARVAARGAGRLGATKPIGGQAMRMATQGRNRFTKAIGRGVVNATAYTTAFGRGVVPSKKPGEAPTFVSTSLKGSIVNQMKYHWNKGKKKKKKGGGGHGGGGGGQTSQGEKGEEPEEETET